MGSPEKAVHVLNKYIMNLLIIKADLGTQALEELVGKILQALKLDKNADGKISKAEIFASIAEIAPELFNLGDAIDEVRDLTQTEFQHLCSVAASKMPDYPNVRAEAETLISAIFEAVGATSKVISAVSRLNKTRPETPNAPSPASENEVASKAKKNKMGGA